MIFTLFMTKDCIPIFTGLPQPSLLYWQNDTLEIYLYVQIFKIAEHKYSFNK